MKNMKIIYNMKFSLEDSIKFLDHNKDGIILYLSDKNYVLGIVTDGDIRKAFLNGFGLRTDIKFFMNKKFIKSKSNSQKIINKLFHTYLVNYLIILNKNDTFKKIEVNKDINKFQNLKSLSAFILAGGKGERLHPLTLNCPKPMLAINGKPILEIIINNLQDYGINKIFISINYLKEVIKNHFKKTISKNNSVSFIEEKKFLGTIGSVSLINLKKYKDNELLILNGDIITNLNFYNFFQFYKNTKSDLCIASKLHSVKIPFGVLTTKKSEVIEIKEKPEINNFVSAGTYIINRKIIKLIPKNSPMDMNELIKLSIKKKFKVTCFPIHENWSDIGNIDQFELIKNTFR